MFIVSLYCKLTGEELVPLPWGGRPLPVLDQAPVSRHDQGRNNVLFFIIYTCGAGPRPAHQINKGAFL